MPGLVRVKMFCRSVISTCGQHSGPVQGSQSGPVRSSELTRADPQSVSLRRGEQSLRMTVSLAHSGGGGGQYWGPSQTFISKVGGYKYVTDQYTALLSSIWGREDHLEHRRRDRMVRYPGETANHWKGTWSNRAPTRRRRVFRAPLLKYGLSDCLYYINMS